MVEKTRAIQYARMQLASVLSPSSIVLDDDACLVGF